MAIVQHNHTVDPFDPVQKTCNYRSASIAVLMLLQFRYVLPTSHLLAAVLSAVVVAKFGD